MHNYQYEEPGTNLMFYIRDSCTFHNSQITKHLAPDLFIHCISNKPTWSSRDCVLKLVRTPNARNSIALTYVSECRETLH